MADSFDEAAIVKRANRVGLRTIRQRPKVVDHTTSGEPVFEAKSVRLVLREDGTHFNRLVQCARCSKDVAGSSVRNAADLDRPMNSIICRDCVRAATVPGQQQPLSPPEPDHEIPVAPPSAPPRDDARVARLEAQLQVVVSRLALLADAQEQEATTRGRAVEELAAQLGPLIGAPSAEDLAAVSNESERSAGALAEASAEIRRLDEATRRTAHAQADLDRRLADMGQQVAALPARFDEALAHNGRVAAEVGASTARLDAMEAGIEELRSHLAAQADRLSGNGDLRRSQDELRQEELRSAMAAEAEQRRFGDENVRRSQEQLSVQLQAVEAQLAAAVEGPTARLDALQVAIDELRTALISESERRHQGDDAARQSQDALRQGLEEMVQQTRLSADAAAERTAGLDALQSAVARQGEQSAADVGRLRHESEEVRRSHSEQVQQLRQAFDDERARVRERFEAELARTRQQLDERIHGLAEWLSHAAQLDEERLGALESKLGEAFEGRLARLEQADSRQRDSADGLRARLDRVEEASARLADAQGKSMGALRQALAEIRATMPAADGDRIDTLEKAIEERATDVLDLFDFHAALDAGMGELRLELASLKSATSAVAGAQADVQDRLDELVAAARRPVPEPSPARRRRDAKRAEVAREAGAAQAIEELARNQQRIEAQLARLAETTAGATIAASAHASSQAAALGPIRADVKALHHQLAAQEELLASLRRSMESLRGVIPAPATKAERPKA